MTININADDDEVSTILRHFRPKPPFASNGLHHGLIRRPTGPRHQRRKCCRPDRGFSSVQFIAPPSSSNGGGKIRLAYLHVQAPNETRQCGNAIVYVYVTFEIAVIAKSVDCVRCSAPDDSSALEARIKSRLDQTCDELARFSPTENGTSASLPASEPSLFSIASRLLQSLNDNSPTSPLTGGVDASPSPPLLASRTTEGLGAMVRRFASTTYDPPRPPAATYAILDLATLLVRCAALGPPVVRAPVPPEFTTGGDAARLAFVASDRLYARGFRGEERRPKDERGRHKEPDSARTLLAFFLSLPWTGGSRLTAETSAGDDDDAKSGCCSANGAVVQICLNVGTALGDPSPFFSRLANEHGTIRAYHGTKMSSAWSVLNHGLRNLSFDDALCQNGAMMGEGVYLSSSKRVAESFAIEAAKLSPAGTERAVRHECLTRLLSSTGAVADVVAGLGPLDGYDIVCLPVFEATILRPPRRHPGGRSRNCDTRQNGKYFVCADDELVKITKLHLTVEVSKRLDIWRRLPSRISVSWIVLFVAMVWITR